VKAQPVDPLLTDVLMPLRQGIDLADRVQAASLAPGSRATAGGSSSGRGAAGGSSGLSAKEVDQLLQRDHLVALAEEGTTISVFTPAAYQASMPSRTSDGEP